MEGITKSGFEYTIPEEALDDMDLLECLQKMDEEGKFWIISKALVIMFGQEQKDAYYDFLREKYGRAPVSVITEDVSEIFSGEEVKN